MDVLLTVRANSVTWNPHKLMGVELQCSAMLVREKVRMTAYLVTTIILACPMLNIHGANIAAEVVAATIAATVAAPSGRGSAAVCDRKNREY